MDNAEDGGLDRPPGRPAMRMTWESLLFAHWPLPAEAVRPLVPAALDVDTFDGSAWVGLVPFAMRAVRGACMPPIPTVSHFFEINVRTYVRTPRGQAGVWFFSLDASSRVAVFTARRLWRLNYLAARISLVRDGDLIRCDAERSHSVVPQRPRLRCAWRAGAPRPPSRPGGLDHFLTERYCLYTTDRRGRPRRGRIFHRPWPLREAELLEVDDTLVAAAGMTVPAAAPILYHADRLDVHAWFPQRVARPDA